MFVTDIFQSCLSYPAETEAFVLSLTERIQSTKVSVWLQQPLRLHWGHLYDDYIGDSTDVRSLRRI